MSPELVAWLIAEHEPIAGWAPDPPAADLRCDLELVARLSEIARPVAGTARVFVAGCPVVHHPRGRALAAASGARSLVIGPDWIELDPWPADVAFARGTDILRGHVVRAYARAEAAS